MLELEPALVLAGGLGQVPGSREHHRRRLPTGQQMEDERHGREHEARQGPGGRKAHQATWVERTNA